MNNGGSCYSDFAFIYDRLTSDVEYAKRADYLELLINRHFSKKAELVCDLGCGTGSICTILCDRGYDCIGIDTSPAMLSVAADKANGRNILYLNQSMTEFELYGTVDVFLCLLDSVNYVLDFSDIERMFLLISNYLNPGGIFIFDVNSEYKFENILGNNTYAYETDGIFYTWENFYEDNILDFYLNFFVEDKGVYHRITEHHTQKYHDIGALKDLAHRCGLEVVGVYDDLTLEPPNDESERIFIVLKKAD